MDMTMFYYIVAAIALAAMTGLARSRRLVVSFASVFFVMQAAFAVWSVTAGAGVQSAQFFTFDATGTLFMVLMAIVSPFAFVHSFDYLRDNNLPEFRLYNMLMVLLCTAVSAVYFANNIAVTWIFLEATTICAAGIIYHRRSPETLEATWKYIFVCSTGIAMAYLGVLILSSAAHEGSLSYESLREAVEHCNPLYLKIAFLLVLAGYSCKMEIFPLYTIGVDANFAAPAPAASLISTVLVNAGFVAILRVYRLMAASVVFEWVQSVLVLAGVVSLLIGALFLRRTNNYKRFLSYSTVENMGIAAIGLGIGGVAAWAAVLHVAAHTLIKSSMFLQIGVVRSIYDGYRINRLGDYMQLNRVGAAGLMLGALALLAFPPSPLFVSELMILRQTMGEGQWWLVAVIFLLLCIVIYSIFSRVIKLCYQPNQSPTRKSEHATWLSWSAFSLLAVAFVVGLTMPEWLKVWIEQIVNF